MEMRAKGYCYKDSSLISIILRAPRSFGGCGVLSYLQFEQSAAGPWRLRPIKASTDETMERGPDEGFGNAQTEKPSGTASSGGRVDSCSSSREAFPGSVCLV